MLDFNRDRFSPFTVRLGMFFSRFGLTPNQWTLLTISPALAAFLFLYSGDFIYAAAFFAAAAVFDVIDGAVARVTSTVTKFGGYLDSLIDRYVEFLAIIGLATVAYPPIIAPAGFWTMLLLFGAVMTPFSRALASEKGLSSGALRGGLVERAERMMLLFLAMLLSAYNLALGSAMIAVTAVLVNVTPVQKALKASKLG